MNTDGYTLVEMLVALMMVGLATGGVTLSVSVFSRAERAAEALRSRDAELARMGRSVTDVLKGAGPFRTDATERQLTGDANQSTFSCHDEGGCALTLTRKDGRAAIEVRSGDRVSALPLGSIREPEFRYVSGLDGRLNEAWPPGDRADRLAAVALVDGGSPIGLFRVLREQPMACAFDVRAKGCGSVAGSR